MDTKKIGAYIKYKRQKYNLTQKELAEKLNIMPQTVSKWERGLGIPDIEQLENLKIIFNCSIDDIIESNIPIEDTNKFENIEISENKTKVDIFDNEDNTNIENKKNEEKIFELPVIIEDYNSKESEENKNKSFFKNFFKNSKSSNKNDKKKNLFDFLSKDKLDKVLKDSLNVQYDDIKNANKVKLFSKEIFKTHSKEEQEKVITQGMSLLTDNTKSQITTPWLYFKVFMFLLLATILSFTLFAMGFNVEFAIIFGSLVFVIPLLILIFEINFPRNINIISVIKLFVVGGLAGIIFTLLINNTLNITNTSLAPIIEELAKFIIVIIAVYKVKPKYMISGILIGFSIGAGFDIFETIAYSFSTYIETFYEGIEISSSSLQLIDLLNLASANSLITLIARTIVSMFTGHHIFTGISAALFTFVVGNNAPNISQIFNSKTLLGYLIAVLLHLFWNLHTLITNPIIYFVVTTLLLFITPYIFIMILRIAIAQYQVSTKYNEIIAENE